MKSIICPSCGATDVAVDNGVIYCSYCGTNSILPVKKRRKKEATQELPSKVIIRKNLDEGSAIRDAYIFLATHKNTPGDLFNDFKLTSMSSYWHFVEGMCEFSTTITCSVGYEKKETKNVREKYYDYQAKKTKTHWVTKEFTTIDWKPFSSPFSRSYPIEIEIDTYNDTLAGFFSNYIKGTSDSMRIPFVEESENEDDLLVRRCPDPGDLHQGRFVIRTEYGIPNDPPRRIPFSARNIARKIGDGQRRPGESVFSAHFSSDVARVRGMLLALILMHFYYNT